MYGLKSRQKSSFLTPLICSKIVPDTMDNDLIEGEQLGHLLKCIEYSLLNTQRKLIRTIGLTD